MALSAFTDKSKSPQKKELSEVLGRSSIAWYDLTAWAASEYHPLTEEWTCYSEKWGWSLRLKRKKRAILYMTPQEKRFMVGFILGDKALKAALGMNLPAPVVRQIKTAKRYAEGTPVRLEIRFKKNLETVRKLAVAKMST